MQNGPAEWSMAERIPRCVVSRASNGRQCQSMRLIQIYQASTRQRQRKSATCGSAMQHAACCLANVKSAYLQGLQIRNGRTLFCKIEPSEHVCNVLTACLTQYEQLVITCDPAHTVKVQPLTEMTTRHHFEHAPI